MKSFLKLIRWQNLSMVALTMVLMRYFVIAPLAGELGIVQPDGSGAFMTLQFPLIDFILLVIATVLITAGGYVINDYFDIKTDLINRGKVIVGTTIPRRTAMMWHLVLNAAGILIGFYISWRSGYPMFGAIFLIVSGLLYFYSASYKRQFLIGNIVVSALTGLVPLLVVLYEWPAMFRYYNSGASSSPDIDFILSWVCGFALFAFLTSLAREIIKDIEDFEGDAAYGRNTVPIVLGIVPSRIVAAVLVIIVIALLYLTWYFYIHDSITLIYLSTAVVIPLLIVLYKLTKSFNRENLHSASHFMKISMLSGILYSVIVKIILTWNLV